MTLSIAVNVVNMKSKPSEDKTVDEQIEARADEVLTRALGCEQVHAEAVYHPDGHRQTRVLIDVEDIKKVIAQVEKEARIDELLLSGQVYAFYARSQELNEDTELPILHDNSCPRKEEMLHNRAQIAEVTLKHMKARLAQLRKDSNE